MIIIIGIAGAGKSTQGQLLAKKLGCPWLSTGQLLRQHIAGQQTLKKMLNGEILNDDVLLPLLDAELKRLAADSRELVLDGSPRTMRQAQWLADKIKADEIKLTAVVHLKASKKVVMERLLARGRPDDTVAAIAQRFSEFDQTIVPIVNFFQTQGFKVHEIDGEGPVKIDAKRINQALEL